MFWIMLAQASAAPMVVNPSPGIDNTTLGIGAVVIGIVAWFLKNKFNISLPSIPITPTPPIPLPDTVPTTDRPILDWMAAILLAKYGNDPKIAKAIKEQMEALKAELDALNVPSPISGAPR